MSLKMKTQRIILTDQGEEITRTVNADLDRVIVGRKRIKANVIYYKTDKKRKGRVLFEREV